MDNALHVGDYLKQRLVELSKRHEVIGDVRGAGLFIGVELIQQRNGTPAPELAKSIINGLRDRHVLIGAAGRFGSVLKIRPPLCICVAQADQLIAALDDALNAAH